MLCLRKVLREIYKINIYIYEFMLSNLELLHKYD